MEAETIQFLNVMIGVFIGFGLIWLGKQIVRSIRETHEDE